MCTPPSGRSRVHMARVRYARRLGVFHRHRVPIHHRVRGGGRAAGDGQKSHRCQGRRAGGRGGTTIAPIFTPNTKFAVRSVVLCKLDTGGGAAKYEKSSRPPPF